ncbi:MAG TPA: hypothetical protein VGK67_32035 [Myxococcales bacterium]|jgi:hypothetical protein
MRALRLLTLGLAITCSLAACGNNTPKPGPDAGLPPEQYFGLQKGRCFEYTTGDVAETAPALGVMVERMDTTQFSVPTYEIAYRIGGGVAMLDYVAFDQDGAMLLYKRSFQGGKSYIYDPPLKRLLQPVFAGDRVESSSEVRIRDGSGALLATETHNLTADIFDDSDVSLPIGKTVTANKIAFQEKKADGTAATRSEFRTFAAGLGDRSAADGFVKVEFDFTIDGTGGNLVYKLQKVRDLGEDPSTANPPCGGAP